ncbi:Protein of unknown function DUF58 [Eubacterium ruminantium]|nr:Protein of unknown function DUF58 [Eubacterium ruminantium]
MKTRIHFERIIFYIILFLIVFGIHDFMHSHLFMMLMWGMIIFPVLSIILCLYVRHSIFCKISVTEQRTEKNAISFVKLSLSNKAFFPVLNVRVNWKAENKFYHQGKNMEISMASAMRHTEEMLLPMRLTNCGIVEYSIDKISVIDLMGFVELKKDNPSSAEITVLPSDGYRINTSLTDINRGMTEAEETQKKGHDFSDVNDVREYIPGDKLMSIHWKLSAKRDILMVKDRVSMSDQQMVILVDIAGGVDEVDEVMELSYSIVKGLVMENLFVKFMWWSETRYEFEERQLMNIEDVKNAFSDMVYEQIYFDSDKTKELMRSIKPELKAYVNVLFREGEAVAVVVEQD